MLRKFLSCPHSAVSLNLLNLIYDCAKVLSVPDTSFPPSISKGTRQTNKHNHPSNGFWESKATPLWWSDSLASCRKSSLVSIFLRRKDKSCQDKVLRVLVNAPRVPNHLFFWGGGIYYKKNKPYFFVDLFSAIFDMSVYLIQPKHISKGNNQHSLKNLLSKETEPTSHSCRRIEFQISQWPIYKHSWPQHIRWSFQYWPSLPNVLPSFSC